MSWRNWRDQGFRSQPQLLLLAITTYSLPGLAAHSIIKSHFSTGKWELPWRTRVVFPQSSSSHHLSSSKCLHQDANSPPAGPQRRSAASERHSIYPCHLQKDQSAALFLLRKKLTSNEPTSDVVVMWDEAAKVRFLNNWRVKFSRSTCTVQWHCAQCRSQCSWASTVLCVGKASRPHAHVCAVMFACALSQHAWPTLPNQLRVAVTSCHEVHGCPIWLRLLTVVVQYEYLCSKKGHAAFLTLAAPLDRTVDLPRCRWAKKLG